MCGCLKLVAIVLMLLIIAVALFQFEADSGAPALLTENITRQATRPRERAAPTRIAASLAVSKMRRPRRDTPIPPTAARVQPTKPNLVDERFASPQTRYTHGVVKLRAGPDTSYDLVGSVAAKSKLSILGKSGQWFMLTYGGRDVFIAGWLTYHDLPRPAQQQPAEQQPAPNQQPSYSCNCSKTCGQMSSCREAYFQLNNCGCRRRDSDNDGAPCESICS